MTFIRLKNIAIARMCTKVNDVYHVIPQVVETIDGSVKPRDDIASGEFLDSLGTHYVRSVTYGVEMVTSLSFKSSSKSSKYV